MREREATVQKSGLEECATFSSMIEWHLMGCHDDSPFCASQSVVSGKTENVVINTIINYFSFKNKKVFKNAKSHAVRKSTEGLHLKQNDTENKKLISDGFKSSRVQ